ncbi:MAG: hydrogenase maturation protease [Ignavibacteriales bacterium]|nr:hydrogenase maturation protease [Ignavibacteriales bacterium]
MNLKELSEILSDFNPQEIVFVGLGNPSRGDDIAGLIFIDKLQLISQFSKAHFIEAGTNPENYLQQILNLNAKVIVFIDAINWGGETGEIILLPADKIDSLSISTHTFSIKMIEEYLGILQELKFLYIGIQPGTLQFDKETTNVVQKKIELFFNNFVT